MSGLNDELWMKERYEQVCRKNPEEYALISLKIKRFRIFNRLFGREAGDWLVGQVYEAIRTWIGEAEYVAHIQLGYFNLLVHMPEDYEEIFQYVIKLNARIRDPIIRMRMTQMLTSKMPSQAKIWGDVYKRQSCYCSSQDGQPTKHPLNNIAPKAWTT